MEDRLKDEVKQQYFENRRLKKNTTVYVDEELQQKIDELAEFFGVTKTALYKRAIFHYAMKML